MQYLILNRMDARKSTYQREAPDTAIISITDINRKNNEFYPQEWLKALLEIKFADVTEGQPGCITRAQAKEIADFANEIQDNCERLIVHCEYGQSRSAAVAAAISKFFEGHDSGIHKNPAYHPNRTCFQYVLDALRGRSK